LFRELTALRSQYETVLYARRGSRAGTGGFDPDISSMKSWSLTTKARKQSARDAEEQHFLIQLERAIYG